MINRHQTLFTISACTPYSKALAGTVVKSEARRSELEAALEEMRGELVALRYGSTSSSGRGHAEEDRCGTDLVGSSQRLKAASERCSQAEQRQLRIKLGLDSILQLMHNVPGPGPQDLAAPGVVVDDARPVEVRLIAACNVKYGVVIDTADRWERQNGGGGGGGGLGPGPGGAGRMSRQQCGSPHPSVKSSGLEGGGGGDADAGKEPSSSPSQSQSPSPSPSPPPPRGGAAAVGVASKPRSSLWGGDLNGDGGKNRGNGSGGDESSDDNSESDDENVVTRNGMRAPSPASKTKKPTIQQLPPRELNEKTPAAA